MSPVALVTAASSSLGRQIISQLTASGYRVYPGFSSELDLINDSSCRAVIRKIIRRYHRLDAVINVAGVSLSGPGLSYSAADLQRLLDVNTVGTFRLLKSASPYLTKAVPGRVIVICSLSGLVAFPDFSLYSASKFALRALCLSLHHELKPQNIYLTCVCPGAIARPGPIPPTSARARFPFLRWLLPFTTDLQVARTISALLAAPHPPVEVTVGRDAQVLSLLFRFLPNRFWHGLQGFIWQKQR